MVSLKDIIKEEELKGNYGYKYSPEEELKGMYSNKVNKKPLKESNIMKGRSDLKKKGDKYAVETELNIKKGLEPKVKQALKKSIIQEANEKIGAGIRRRSLSFSSSSSEEDEKPSKKPIDKKELKNYARMLSHLLEHIEDPKEPIDKKDYKDAKKLIDNMEVVKRKRGRPRKN